MKYISIILFLFANFLFFVQNNFQEENNNLN